MRHLILASLLLLCHFGAFSQDVWQWLNPQPSGSNCINITFTDRQHGFILNYNGDLMRTSDQGAHWQITDHFPIASQMEIADSTGVIVCTNGTLYVSSDNGNTWSLVNSGLAGRMISVSIVSRDTFFVTSSYQLIYKTTDRGKTLTTLSSQNSMYASAFLDSKTGFISGSQSLLKTIDGGQTWIQKDSIHYFNSIQFVNADSGFALAGGNDTLLKTVDGGETWHVLDTVQDVSVMHFINSKTGFIESGVGGIQRTDDGGTTWTSVIPANTAKFTYLVTSLYFLDEKTGFGAGYNGRILKTTNGGQTWSHYSPTNESIRLVSFPTASTGYMSDGYGIFKTTNGGQHWDSLSYVTGSSFSQVHFSSADTGYFLSTNPVREHRTTDGGHTWSVFNPSSIDWSAASGQHYFGPHSGFVSCGGQLLKTVDDGISWSSVWQAQDSSEFMDLIFFTDSLNGFARRGFAQLMKTTDGGITWSLTYNTPRGCTGLWFFDPLNGFVINQNAGGVAYVTHDGGISFSSVNLTTNFIGAMHTIGFFNKQIGYFTADGNGDFGMGSFGHVYKTIDGGQTWKISIDDVKGNVIVFTPDSNVLIAGDGGQLIESKIQVLQIDSPTCTTPQNLPAPVLTNNAGILISSASQGNHWFLNGIEIPDAHDQQYTTVDTGHYSVRIIDSCAISPMSNIVIIQANNSSGTGLHIHPNPVLNQLVIDNPESAPLEFVIMNMTGETILTGSSSDKQIYINAHALPSGQYILRIRNRNTSSTSSQMFLKS